MSPLLRLRKFVCFILVGVLNVTSCDPGAFAGGFWEA